MSDQELLNYVRGLLHNTFSGSDESIQASQKALDDLFQKNQLFPEIIKNIALFDPDTSIQKSAIIQIKKFNPKIILNLFVLFNEQLDPKLHQMVTILSDQIKETYFDYFVDFILHFNPAANDINGQKTLLMAFQSLFMHLNEEFISTDKFQQLLSKFENGSVNNSLIIIQCFKQGSLSQQQILFMHYFTHILLRVFYRKIDKFEKLHEFIHPFLCASLTLKVDFIYPELNTDIVNVLFDIYSSYISLVSQEPQYLGFLNSIKLNEIFESFYNFCSSIPKQNWPLNFCPMLKTILLTPFFCEKFGGMIGEVIDKFVFPLFSFDFYTNIVDESEFVDLFYPSVTSECLQAQAAIAIQCCGTNENLTKLMYDIAFAHLMNCPPELQNQNVFKVLNIMSKCIFANTDFERNALTNFCNFIADNLLNFNDPLVSISVMNFISSVPRDFELRPEFVAYVYAALFENIPLPPFWLNVLSYFSVIAYSNLLNSQNNPFADIKVENQHIILFKALEINNYFGTERASEALLIITQKLKSVSPEVSIKLINTIWTLFMNDYMNDINSAGYYLNTLTSLVEISPDENKMRISNEILSRIENLFLQSEQSLENRNSVLYIVKYLSDEFFECFKVIFSTMHNFCPGDQFNDLFVRLSKILGLMIPLIQEDQVDWESLNITLKLFVNLGEKIDYKLLLGFFDNLINTIINCQWEPCQFDSCKVLIERFCQFEEVQEFAQKYGELILEFCN